MTNRKKQIAGLRRSIETQIYNYLQILTTIVEEYFLTETILGGPQRGNLIRDWFNFCITKSCKTLAAITLLLEAKLAEDVLILLRSVYENYISIVYVLANPDKIDDSIQKPLGLKIGLYHHPINKNGRIDRRKVVKKATGELLSYGLNVSQLAKGSSYKSDEMFYKYLYSFLSEIVHPHILNMGNYQNDSNLTFTSNDTSKALDASFLTLFLYTLILAEVYDMEQDEIEQPEGRILRNNLHKGIKILFTGLKRLSDCNLLDSHDSELLSKRLSDTVNAKEFLK